MNDQPSTPSSRSARGRARGPLFFFGTLFVVAVAVWMFVRPDVKSENGQPSMSETTTSYTDTEFGFSLTYPSDWKVERNSTGEGENRIVNIVMGDGSKGITIVVIPVALEGVVRESVSITAESEITINGKQATRIQARTAKDGSSIDLLLFRSRGMLIDLNGPADLVEQIGGTMSFQQ